MVSYRRSRTVDHLWCTSRLRHPTKGWYHGTPLMVHRPPSSADAPSLPPLLPVLPALRISITSCILEAPREICENDLFLTPFQWPKISKKRVISYGNKVLFGSKMTKSSRKTRKTHFSHQKSRNSRWSKYKVQRARLGTPNLPIEISAAQRKNFLTCFSCPRTVDHPPPLTHYDEP